MPDTPPYSGATVELVAGHTVKMHCNDPDCEQICRADADAKARDILDALAAAGLLLPEGAERRTETEWKYRLTYNDGVQKERPCDSLDVARLVAASPANWQEPGRPGEVFERQVTTVIGPWSPVPPEPSEPA